MLSLPAYRRSKAITVTLPDEWVDKEVHLFGFVQDNNGRTSDSVYLGEWSEWQEPTLPFRHPSQEGTETLEGTEGVEGGGTGLGDADGKPAADGLVEAEAVHVIEGG